MFKAGFSEEKPPPSHFRYRRVVTFGLLIVSAFYAYGALVHVLNILGLTGFDWLSAPFKWQVLDIVYLVLDLLVAALLVTRSKVAIVSFYIAATSQIALYTIGRSWVLDVPPEFAPSNDQIAYLDTLVMFHILSITFVSGLLIWDRHLSKKESPSIPA